MSELYRSKGLNDQRVQEILKTIRRVKTDDDWDGISAGAQVKFHFPKVEVTITGKKFVSSNPTTLVLDKGTNDDGWIIDHHTSNPYTNRNVLGFSTSGEAPTSRVTYVVLDKRLDADLFLSATAEVTDDLYRTGMDKGSLNELATRMPHYFNKSKLKNQFLKEGIVYSMADILAIVSRDDPEHAFRLGLRFYERLPKDSDELTDMLDSHNRRLVERYKKFMREFKLSSFEEVEVHGRKVMMMDRRGIGEFYVPVLTIARRAKPGNYILFKGKEVSIRTNDSALLNFMTDRLKDVSYDHGGRAGSYGAKFKESMTYGQFKELIRG